MEIVLCKLAKLRLPMARYGFVSHAQYGILVSYAASCAHAYGTSTKAGEFKTKLKINHWRSSPGPPELAGFYVDSVWDRTRGFLRRQRLGPVDSVWDRETTENVA